MTKRLAVLVFMAVTLAGCQVLKPSPEPALPPATRVSNPTPLPRAGSGRLAYIGADGNVYVTTADGSSTIAVTADATVGPEKMGLSYHRISWSPDGRLAFAAVNRLRDAAPSKLYVTEAPGQPARLVGQSDQYFVIYIYWSPVECQGRPSCRRLGYLIENEVGIGLRLVEIDTDGVENRLVGTGRPFYFSWGPDGRQILWHTGGDNRYNDQAGLAMYDIEQDQVESLPYRPGSFLAPAWSPQGERWLAVAIDGAAKLQSFAQGRPATVITRPDRHTVFNWSPDGKQVAYAEALSDDEPVYGPIHVFDMTTGQSRQITDAPFRIVSFFWSPDGRQLGYLKQVAPDADWWQWRLYNLVENKDRGFAAFIPSFHMRFIISSFNQYAQSHRFWSPDGRYLTYADQDNQLVERVWLIDTWADKWARPILIAEGVIGIWSWD